MRMPHILWQLSPKYAGKEALISTPASTPLTISYCGWCEGFDPALGIGGRRVVLKEGADKA